jgi:hypothetical protein
VTVDRPLFSILSSAYRTEPYLAATIDSVRAQTLDDWELIVVDNGMSDEVERIVSGYRDDQRIRLIRQENRGLAGAINVAAEAARGQYYAVLDSDDLLAPEFCARTAAFLQAHPDVDAVGIDAHLFDDHDGRDQVRGYRRSIGISTPADPDRPVTLVDLIGGQMIYYTAAIRAAAWEVGRGYSADHPRVEELTSFIRMLAAGCDVRVLDERLARYRLRGDSASRDPAQVEAFEKSCELAFIEAAELSPDPRVQEALDASLRRMRFDQAMRRGRAALLDGDVETAKAQARRALQQRRSARPAAVLAGLTVAPGVLRRIHPAKQAVTRALAGAARTIRRRDKAPA